MTRLRRTPTLHRSGLHAALLFTALATLCGGCELIVDFDRDRIGSSADAGADASPADGAVDASPDASADGGSDASADGGNDASADASLDASADA
ncbi:MAG: hypothetical protein OEY14_16745, partial [Myxococcales bacterium]|nr:hypothetical protein [Myxococcales bacterium]